MVDYDPNPKPDPPVPAPEPEPTDGPDPPAQEKEAVVDPLSLTRPGYPDIHGTFGTNLADRGD
jgi:hypothetical protein